MNVTVFGKSGSSFIILTCWNEQFQRPAGIAFFSDLFLTSLLFGSRLFIVYGSHRVLFIYEGGWAVQHLSQCYQCQVGEKRGKALSLLELSVLVLFKSSTFNLSSLLVAQAIPSEPPALY